MSRQILYSEYSSGNDQSEIQISNGLKPINNLGEITQPFFTFLFAAAHLRVCFFQQKNYVS